MFLCLLHSQPCCYAVNRLPQWQVQRSQAMFDEIMNLFCHNAAWCVEILSLALLWRFCHVSGKELAEQQMKEEDLTCLPTILISDIDKEMTRTELQHVSLGRLL